VQYRYGSLAHFGTNAKMWNTSAPNTWCRNVFGPKCLRSEVSVHRNYTQNTYRCYPLTTNCSKSFYKLDCFCILSDVILTLSLHSVVYKNISYICRQLNYVTIQIKSAGNSKNDCIESEIQIINLSIYRVVQKTDTQFYFRDNFNNSAPILTILSLL